MRKLISVIITTAVLTVCLLSCKSETYTDKLNDEKKAIEKFIHDNKIDVVYEFPKDGVFKDNVFFKDKETGVYIHVIDRGNDERPSKSRRTKVSFRFDTIYNLLQNTAEANPSWSSYEISFKFGDNSSYTHSSTDYTLPYYYLSQGCVLPFEHDLGNGAEVKLIIPFENGSLAQQSSYTPYYYSRVRYTFILDDKEE